MKCYFPTEAAGLRTPDEAFFNDISNFWADWPNKFWDIRGILGRTTISPHFGTVSNQVRVVTVSLPQLRQALFLQKKSNIAKSFFDICNAEMAQSLSSLQKSEF